MEKVTSYIFRVLCVLMIGVFFLTEGMVAQSVSLSGNNRVMALNKWQNNKKLLQNANSRVTLNVSNVPLAKALKLIAGKASTGLYYNSGLVSGKKVTIHIKDMPLSKALQKALQGTWLKAVASGRNIMIQKRELQPVRLSDISVKLTTIQETVSGTVTDGQTGEPLPGVNILVVGTSTGTATDANGHYSLQVENLQDTLRFSFIGYQKQTIPINNRNTIDVVMKSQVLSGQQLVVVGFGTQRRKNVTGSVATIDSSQFNTGNQSSGSTNTR